MLKKGVEKVEKEGEPGSLHALRENLGAGVEKAPKLGIDVLVKQAQEALKKYPKGSPQAKAAQNVIAKRSSRKKFPVV
jgi:hypothetical protein